MVWVVESQVLCFIFFVVKIPLEERASEGCQPQKNYGTDFQESEVKNLMVSQVDDDNDVAGSECKVSNSKE